MNFHCCNKTPNFSLTMCMVRQKNLLKFLKAFYLKQESTNFMSERHLKNFKDLGKLSQIGIHDAGLHVF